MNRPKSRLCRKGRHTWETSIVFLKSKMYVNRYCPRCGGTSTGKMQWGRIQYPTLPANQGGPDPIDQLDKATRKPLSRVLRELDQEGLPF